VISFQDSIAHMGSREQLIGKHPAKDQINIFPTNFRLPKKHHNILVHASDDDA